LVTLIMLAGGFGLFWWARRVEGLELAPAQTIVMNVIVMVELCYMFNCRFLLRPVLGRDFLANRWVFVGAFGMVAAQLAMTYVPFMNALFHTAPLSLANWGWIMAVALTAFAAVEVEKWIRQKLGRGTTV
jgi:magnesium-transporting ATPase (P-type)